MIIDFHTHAFPDAIAERTIEKLAAMIEAKPYTNGTLDGLKESMKRDGVDYSVVLPIITRPAQFQTVNQYAKDITGKDGIISFGSVHPKADDVREEINIIKKLGLKGIKLHPDFQDTFIDEPCYMETISYALEQGLLVTIHAGVDEGIPEPVHCPPDKAAYMLNQVGKNGDISKIILAHTGGFHQWDEVEELIVGTSVYLDISFCRGYIKKEQMERIIRNHGADKILFGSDSPWDGQKETIDYVRSLNIEETMKNQILGENGKRLLGL